MCGRFYLDVDFEELIAKYGYFENIEWDLKNPEIFPTNDISVIVDDGKAKLTQMKWGFTPSFAKLPLINARAESCLEKSTFRNAVLSGRCIVPASGYFEWMGEKGHKTKFKICSEKEKIISMAGIFASFRNEEGILENKVTLLTTNAHDSIKEIHHRMPLIVEGDMEKLWMKPSNNISIVKEILKYSYSGLHYSQVR